LPQIEERKRLHAKLMQKVRERQMKPSEAADEINAEVCPPLTTQDICLKAEHRVHPCR
jgi:hypothetical protein